MYIAHLILIFYIMILLYCIEEIQDFSINYAVLDTLSLEYYFSIKFI